MSWSETGWRRKNRLKITGPLRTASISIVYLDSEGCEQHVQCGVPVDHDVLESDRAGAIVESVRREGDDCDGPCGIGVGVSQAGQPSPEGVGDRWSGIGIAAFESFKDRFCDELCRSTPVRVDRLARDTGFGGDVGERYGGRPGGGEQLERLVEYGNAGSGDPRVDSSSGHAPGTARQTKPPS
ncbi:MAG: hypothetical protein V9G12_08675 [Microthrixaceae bacterium]